MSKDMIKYYVIKQIYDLMKFQPDDAYDEYIEIDFINYDNYNEEGQLLEPKRHKKITNST